MNSQEIWQIQVQDRIYEASYSEVIQWIKEGSIQPEDKVRRGNLRWLEASKVPELNRLFLQRDADTVITETVADSDPQWEGVYTHFQVGNSAGPGGPNQSVYVAGNGEGQTENSSVLVFENPNAAGAKTLPTVCSIHAEREPVYICEICKDLFCRTCPNSFGSSVKICPRCGGLCVAFHGWEAVKEKTHGAVNKPYPRREVKAETQQLETRLEKKDFINALKNPFNFPGTLAVGLILFSLLVFGQIFSLTSDILAITATFGISAILIMLTFSILSKNRENFAQGNFKANFLPRLNKFTVWEDFLHPLLLGIGAYLAAFGLFLAVAAGAGAYAWHQFSSEIESVEAAIRQTHQRMSRAGTAESTLQADNLEQVIADRRDKQHQSVFGTGYFGSNEQLTKVTQSFMRLSLHFHMPICFMFILGVLLFPAASLVAIGTRSVGKTLNPLCSLRAMKDLGFDYFKILFVSLVYLVVAGASVAASYLLFSHFEIPLAGIIIGIFVGSLISFYFWLVFSYLVGLAIHRGGEKLEI